MAVSGVVVGAGIFSNDAPQMDQILVENQTALIDGEGKKLILGDPQELLELSTTAKDSEGIDALKFSWSIYKIEENQPEAIAAGMGRFHAFSPKEVGVYEIRFRVTDGGFWGLAAKSDEVRHRVSVVLPNAPVARIVASSEQIEVGETVSLDASTSSFQSGGRRPSFNWTVIVGNESFQIGRGSSVTFTPERPESHIVQLQMVDQFDTEDSSELVLEVDLVELPQARIQAARKIISPNEQVRLDGVPNSQELSFAWTLGNDDAILGTSSTFLFSSPNPGEHELKFRIGDQWQVGETVSEVIKVLQSRQISDVEATIIEGTKFYNYEGQQLILEGEFLTNGVPTVILAHTIQSKDATIRAFSADAKSGAVGATGAPGASGNSNGASGLPGGNGGVGARGADGASAGLIRIEATRLFGDLTIDNSGQNAGSGGAGGTGGVGGNGFRGNNGASGLFDCSRGPQSGGNGGAGGSAGNGGDGGDGGDAGPVKVEVGETGERATLDIRAVGGTGGNEGSAGAAANGGSGAPRGSAPGNCSQTARNGVAGANGGSAIDGSTGQTGQTQIIEILIDGQPARTASGSVLYQGK